MHTLLRGLALTLVLVGAVGCFDTAAEDPKEKKGVVIEIDDMKNTAPAAWKSEEPTNKMRYMQFVLPRVGEDKNDAELVIFKGLGGSAEQNIERWKKTFVPPEGKKIEDVAKVTPVKVGKGEGQYLDMT